MFGGIAGRLRTSGLVTYSYNIGKVTNTGGGLSTGGIVGSQENGTMSYCYNFASVTSNGSRVGTIVGYKTGTVKSSYNVSGSEPNPNVYYVVNGLSDGESEYWSKDNMNAPSLKWESKK